MSANSNAKPIVRRRRVSTTRGTEIPTLLTVPDLRQKSIVAPVTTTATDAIALEEAANILPAGDIDSSANQASQAASFSPLFGSGEPRTEFAIDPPKQKIGVLEQAVNEVPSPTATTQVPNSNSGTILRNAVSSTFNKLSRTGITTIRPQNWFSKNWRNEIGTLATIAAAIFTCTVVARSLQDHPHQEEIAARAPDESSTSDQEQAGQAASPTTGTRQIQASPFARPVDDTEQPSGNFRNQPPQARPNNLDRVARVPVDTSSFSPPRQDNQPANVDPWARPAFGGSPTQSSPDQGAGVPSTNGQFQQASHFQAQQTQTQSGPRGEYAQGAFAPYAGSQPTQSNAFSSPVPQTQFAAGGVVNSTPQREATSQFGSPPMGTPQSLGPQAVRTKSPGSRYETPAQSPTLPPLPNQAIAADSVSQPAAAGYPATPSHYRPLNHAEATAHNQQVTQQTGASRYGSEPQASPDLHQADRRGANFQQNNFFNNNGGVRR